MDKKPNKPPSKIQTQVADQSRLPDHLLVEIYSRLLLSTDVSLEVSAILGLLGKLVGADRARLFLLDETKENMECVGQWCGDGVKELGEEWQKLSARDYSWLMTRLWGSQYVRVKSLEEIEYQFGRDKELLGQQGINNLLLFPMPLMRTLGGHVQFDNPKLELSADDLGAVFSLVRALGNALTRSHMVDRHRGQVGYEAVFDSLEDGVIVFDNQGKLSAINQQAAEVLGKPMEYFADKQMKDLGEVFSGGSLDVIFKNVELAKLNRQAPRVDLELPREEGEVIHVEVGVGSLKDRGQVRGSVVTVADVTLRKRIEREVQESEARLSRVLESVKEGITLSDETGNFVIFNPEMEGLTGYSHEEANQAKQFAELVHPHEEVGQVLSELAQLQAGQKLTKETRLIAKGGEEKQVLVSTTVVENDNRRMYLSSFHDITELKQTHEELKDARDHLEEKVEEKTKELADKVVEVENLAKFSSEDPFPVLRVSGEGVLMYHNAASGALLATWGTEENQPVPEKWQGMVREVYETNNRKVVEEELSGQVLSFVLVPVKSGGYVNMYGRDVTREKEVEDMKNEFMSMVSHQVRTPLTSMRWYSEMLLASRDKFEPEQVETMETIHGTAVKLSELVNDLLSISRMESGRLDYEPERGSVVAVVKEVIKDMDGQASDKQVEVVLEAGEVQEFMFDQQLVREVYMNLVSNAIKYSSSGGKVWVRVRVEEDEVVSEVEDAGMGIPEEAQKEIFGRFYRAQNAVDSGIEGTGLGLSVAKMMVEKCGGSISFVSPVHPELVGEGKGGTCFSFSLPMRLT